VKCYTQPSCKSKGAQEGGGGGGGGEEKEEEEEEKCKKIKYKIKRKKMNQKQ